MNKHIPILLLILCLIPLTTAAQSSFTRLFQFEGTDIPAHADQITEYYLYDSDQTADQQLEKFQHIEQQLKQANSDTAVDHFIEGLNYLNILSALKQQDKNDEQQKDAVYRYNFRLTQAFQQALSADEKAPQLTAAMYATISRSQEVGIKIQALKNELKLGGSVENETSYWFTHWQLIGALKDAGRLDEAEQALQQMKQELNAAQQQNSVYAEAQQRAQQELNEVRQKLQGNNNAVQKTFSKFGSLFDKYWPLMVINIIILLSLIYTFVKYKNRK